MEWRVELDVYHGPLDLLLYLIRRDELDIHDIPIAKITDSYLAYVEALRGMSRCGLDIDRIGEFLVVAATLLEIKSATLLPAPPPEAAGSAAAELADPRQELIRQLLEYKRLRDTAALLEARRIEHEQRFRRTPAELAPSDEPPPIDLDEVQVWDLLSAFSRLLGELSMRAPRAHEILYDDTPIDLHAADVEDRLRRDGPRTLRDLLAARVSRSEMIGVFLAVLELMKQRRVAARETDDAEIELIALEPPPSAAEPEADANPAVEPDASPAIEPNANPGVEVTTFVGRRRRATSPDALSPPLDPLAPSPADPT